MALIALGFSALGVQSLYLSVQQSMTYGNNERWTLVDAVIVSSEVQHSGTEYRKYGPDPPVFTAKVVYEYTVSGTLYRADRIAPDDERHSDYPEVVIAEVVS